MDQTRVLVHASVVFHAEVPLVALPCLAHLRIPLPIFVLGGAGRRDQGGIDDRALTHRHAPSSQEGQRILLTCNQAEYASLLPSQIVPALDDQWLYIGSESSFYRVLHAHGQVHRRGRARPPQEPWAVLRLRASGAIQLWSWAISYLPITVCGFWLYLYLVIDVLSRKVVAWDVDEREDPAFAPDLVRANQQGSETAADPLHG